MSAVSPQSSGSLDELVFEFLNSLLDLLHGEHLSLRTAGMSTISSMYWACEVSHGLLHGQRSPCRCTATVEYLKVFRIVCRRSRQCTGNLSSPPRLCSQCAEHACLRPVVRVPAVSPLWLYQLQVRSCLPFDSPSHFQPRAPDAPHR